jgi:hypothetical protein
MAPHLTSEFEDHPCWLSATVYSVYSPLSFIHNLRTYHAIVTRVPLNMAWLLVGKPEVKEPLRRPRHMWVDKETSWKQRMK